MSASELWKLVKPYCELIYEAAQRVQVFLWLLGALVLLLFVVSRFRKSYQLLRMMYAGETRGNLGPVLSTLLKSYVQSLDLELPGTFGAPHMYLRVRRRVEHEMFHPLPEDADTPEQVHQWHERMAEAATDDTIGDDNKKGIAGKITAGTVNDAFDSIQRYFRCLKSLGTRETDLTFLCTLKIATGFVAPLHLVAGMLSRFDEDWSRIVAMFDHDVLREEIEEPQTHALLAEIRRIQKFLFDCWLVWGPSIPVGLDTGDSSGWGGDPISVQYGFGDENNSIELVASRHYLNRALTDLWKETPSFVLARSAVVIGRLAHSTVVLNMNRQVADVLQTSWNMDRGRILLLLDEASDTKAKKPVAANNAGSYYSAYIWIMFVVMRWKEDEKAWVPVHPGPRSNLQKPWLDLLPFFEHCNIACPKMLNFGMDQLARKALEGIQRLTGRARAADPNRCPLRFAYACAIDDGGDGRRLWIDRIRGETPAITTLRDRIEKLKPDYPDLFQGQDSIVLLDHYKDRPNQPYAAWMLPEHIRRVYQRGDKPQVEPREASDPPSANPLPHDFAGLGPSESRAGT